MLRVIHALRVDIRRGTASCTPGLLASSCARSASSEKRIGQDATEPGGRGVGATGGGKWSKVGLRSKRSRMDARRTSGRCQVHNQGGPDDARCNPEQAWRTPRTHPGWVRKHRQQPGEGLKQESTETTGDKKATDGNHTDIIGSTRNHRNPNGIRQKNTESRRRAALKLKRALKRLLVPTQCLDSWLVSKHVDVVCHSFRAFGVGTRSLSIPLTHARMSTFSLQPSKLGAHS